MQQELSFRNSNHPNSGSLSISPERPTVGFPQGEVLSTGTVLIPVQGQQNLYTRLPIIGNNSNLSHLNTLQPGSIIIHNIVGQETNTHQEGGTQITQQEGATQTTQQEGATQTIQQRNSFSFGSVLGYLAVFSVGLISGILGIRAYDSKKTGVHIRQNRSLQENKFSQNRIRRLQLGPMATFEF